MFNWKFKPPAEQSKPASDNIIVHEDEGEEEPLPFNPEAEGYVLGGIRYIPLGVVDSDFSQALSNQTIDFMRIAHNLNGFAYLSSGQVYNGTSNPITLTLYSQYTTFGQPKITLQAGAYYSWENLPVTGVFGSVATSAVTISVVKYAAKDEGLALRAGLLQQTVSKQS